MTEDLSNWKGCKHPEFKVFDGHFVRLEPMDVDKHADDLYIVSSGEGAEQRMKYLWEVPESKEKFMDWMKKMQNLKDPMFFAVIDKASGKVGGRQSFLRIVPAHGVVEIGHIMWGPLISRRPAATEAIYLMGKYVFEELGYRRLEWKCHNDNKPSKRAAERFGFKHEAIFRQDFVMKGANRDTAWFAMIDKEWPEVKEAMEKWLHPDNFDDNGIQRKRLEEFRQSTS